jgi:hypothetical protein
VSTRRLRRARAPRRALAAALLAMCTATLADCGDTLQDQPIAHNALESLLMAPYPVYWLGHSFQGLAITEAAHDPSGAFSVRYGDCLEGGQGTCVAPLRMVTSPDNSFLAGGSAPRRARRIRGIAAVVAQRGRTIEIPTAGVVLSIYAQNARLARAAAETAVAINEIGAPGEPLAPRLANTGFGERPLPAQIPSPLRADH